MNSLVNEKTGKPPKEYSDSQWQHDFQFIKDKIKPSRFKRMKIIPESVSSYYSYHGKTQYQCYCTFINDILDNIRNGGIDYCFFIYQISELLKY